MPERASGLTERRDRKNEVDMISKLQPSFRAMARARGTLGLSMKPKCRITRVNLSPIFSICTRSCCATRGMSSVTTVKMTLVTCAWRGCRKTFKGELPHDWDNPLCLLVGAAGDGQDGR
jgi:hypothetical protein